VGDLPDVELIRCRKKKALVPRFAAQLARVLKALKTPQTTMQLALVLNFSQSRARVYIHELRATKPKRAYIKDWQDPGKQGDWAPVYALGNRPDKRKPKITRADRYCKDRANDEKYERILAQRRKLHMLDKARKNKQTWASSLGLMAESPRAENRAFDEQP
jgi:hypothetical protein